VGCTRIDSKIPEDFRALVAYKNYDGIEYEVVGGRIQNAHATNGCVGASKQSSHHNDILVGEKSWWPILDC
jgi:hypothetical protein